MKTQLVQFVALVVFLSSTVAATAQKLPKWISANGYWVVETNLKSPKVNVVNFYNNDNQLIYTEKVDGIVLNIRKRKTCLRLKKALEESMVMWAAKSNSRKDELVKNVFRLH